MRLRSLRPRRLWVQYELERRGGGERHAALFRHTASCNRGPASRRDIGVGNRETPGYVRRFRRRSKYHGTGSCGQRPYGGWRHPRREHERRRRGSKTTGVVFRRNRRGRKAPLAQLVEPSGATACARSTPSPRIWRHRRTAHHGTTRAARGRGRDAKPVSISRWVWHDLDRRDRCGGAGGSALRCRRLAPFQP
jgi:hypothetical protein